MGGEQWRRQGRREPEGPEQPGGTARRMAGLALCSLAADELSGRIGRGPVIGRVCILIALDALGGPGGLLLSVGSSYKAHGGPATLQYIPPGGGLYCVAFDRLRRWGRLWWG